MFCEFEHTADLQNLMDLVGGVKKIDILFFKNMMDPFHYV